MCKCQRHIEAACNHHATFQSPTNVVHQHIDEKLRTQVAIELAVALPAAMVHARYQRRLRRAHRVHPPPQPLLWQVRQHSQEPARLKHGDQQPLLLGVRSVVSAVFSLLLRTRRFRSRLLLKPVA